MKKIDVGFAAIWLAVYALLMVLIYFHASVGHEFLYVLGIQPTPQGTSSWYQLWSGFVPSIIIFTGAGGWYVHHTCHASARCVRWGKYEAANGVYKLCHKHHPDFNGKRPTHASIRKAHEDSKG